MQSKSIFNEIHVNLFFIKGMSIVINKFYRGVEEGTCIAILKANQAMHKQKENCNETCIKEQKLKIEDMKENTQEVSC